jgi:Bacterial Ig domain
VTSTATPATPWSLQMVASTNPYEQALSYHLGGAFIALQALIAQLPLTDPLKDMLVGTAITARRTLLNQAPTVAPLTLTGSSDVPVSGQVNAVDAEGDPISYRLVQGPTAGNLTLNADGSFTYTPGQGFDGVDSFVVAAEDLGLHVNLLDPFRSSGTSAGALFNEGAIKFAFNYTTGANYWSADAKSALESSALQLAAYFLVTKPVTLDYDVTAQNDPALNTLATAGSDLISGAPGFWRTVAQNKLLSGVDSNGAAADGTIDWNFGEPWSYGDAVAGNQYDFVSTAMHELMHSFGFLSYVGPPGSNTNLAWTLFASYVTTSTGTRVINASGFWNTAYDPNLTGAGGGLYFDGTNAAAAYGGPVPLFTPNPWQEGSSATHLDDATFTGSNEKLMNAISNLGLGVRVLSPVERGIMQDLGYTVVVPSVVV